MPAGFNVRAGIQREATLYAPTWPSVESSVITGLLPLLCEDVGLRKEQGGLVTVDSQAFTSVPMTFSRQVEGTVSLAATYSSLEFFLTAALGFMAPSIDGIEMPEELDTGIYRHLIEMDPYVGAQTWLADEGWLADQGLIADQKKLRRFTYAIDKQTSLWEAKSCMLGGLQFQGNPAATTFTTGLVGYDVSFTTLVGNDLSALSCPKDQLLFHDCILYLGESGPLGSGNITSDLVGFAFTLENSLQSLHTTSTGIYIDEPARSGPAIVTGNFALPSYMSSGIQLQAWVDQETSLVGCIEFVGENLGAYDKTMWC